MELKRVRQQAMEQNHHDVLFVIDRLLFKSAFAFVATEVEVSVLTGGEGGFGSVWRGVLGSWDIYSLSCGARAFIRYTWLVMGRLCNSAQSFCR